MEYQVDGCMPNRLCSMARSLFSSSTIRILLCACVFTLSTDAATTFDAGGTFSSIRLSLSAPGVCGQEFGFDRTPWSDVMTSATSEVHYPPTSHWTESPRPVLPLKVWRIACGGKFPDNWNETLCVQGDGAICTGESDQLWSIRLPGAATQIKGANKRPQMAHQSFG